VVFAGRRSMVFFLQIEWNWLGRLDIYSVQKRQYRSGPTVCDHEKVIGCSCHANVNFPVSAAVPDNVGSRGLGHHNIAWSSNVSGQRDSKTRMNDCGRRENGMQRARCCGNVAAFVFSDLGNPI